MLLKNKGRIFAVASRKGGVGKTTVTRNMAKQLSCLGYRVLTVDVDSQGNLSLSMGFPKIKTSDRTLYDLIWNQVNDQTLKYEDSIYTLDGVDVIPCNESLAALEMYLVTVMDREKILFQILSALRSQYDFIFLDCGPSLGLMTINALTASDSVLVVTTLEEDSNNGTELLIQSIQRIRKSLNPSLDVIGILLNMTVRRSLLGVQILREIQACYDGVIPIYDTRIPRSADFSKARKAQKSVMEYAPGSKAADAVQTFCDEFLHKGGHLDDNCQKAQFGQPFPG